jgi:hypothetical protein
VNNGAISELPVSDRVRDPEAGSDAAAPASETPDGGLADGGLAGLLPQAVRTPAVRTKAVAAAAVTAIARLPARLLPEGGCAFPVPNDNVALTRLRPPGGQQGLGGPRPLLCSPGKQKMNKRGTNRRPLDVI